MYDDNARILAVDERMLTIGTSFDFPAIDGRVTLEVKPYKPRRSLSQNALFHALCAEIARITGMDASMVKEGIKQAYGVKVKALHGVLVPKPSHMMDTPEMADLIRGAEIELIDAGGDPRQVQNSLT